MRFSVWTNASQSWQSILEMALWAEDKGYDGIWFADHFMPDTPDAAGPIHEAWATVAGLAAAVPRVRIGTLVSGNTYRHPAVLAKMAATIDHISGGRLVLGLGSGWQESEHTRYGIPFGTFGTRLKQLDEACQVIKGLFTQERTTFEGKYYTLQDAPLDPKPVQSPLPLLIGGGGEKVTLRITAKYADEWNTWGRPTTLARKGQVLAEHCAAIGRDPKTIKHSAQALVEITDRPVEEQPRGGRPAIAGTPDQLAEIMQAFADAGVDEFIIPDFTFGAGAKRTAAYATFWDEVAVRFR